MNSVCLQMVSEKVGGAEGTKLDEEFRDLERVRMFGVPSFLPSIHLSIQSLVTFIEETEC